MVLECWVIILILGIAAYMFVRSERKPWALGVLPLMLVPVVNILYSYLPIERHISASNPGLPHMVRIILYIVTFVIGSIWVIVFARALPKGRSKYAYVICSILFTAILIFIFIIKIKT
jgi:hypothetical protein